MSTISASTTSTTAYKVTADTTGTLVLQTGSTPTTAVTVGTDQSVTLAGTLAVQSQNISPYTGFKNRIINGAMVIDQRNAGASVNNVGLSTLFSVDRWSFFGFVSNKFSVQQSTDAPSGFTNSLKVTSSSAYSVPSGETYIFQQSIEGYNLSDLGFGASGAGTVTLSFWVKSSLTGSFGGSLTNNTIDRSYTFAFTINAANTWEYKTVTIAGDTAGTWNKTNSTGVTVRFGLGSGSGFSTAANTWTAGNYVQPPSTVSVVGTNGATFYITGVQLEKGSTATSFDYRPYGTELQLCQRYYQKVSFASGMAVNSTTAYLTTTYGVTMRANPTVSLSGAIAITDGNADFTQSSSSISTYVSAPTGFYGPFANFTGLTAFRPAVATQGSVSILASAEL